MHPTQAFLSAYAIFPEPSDMEAADCSGLEEGQLAVCVSQIATPNADPAGTPFYMYLPTSTVALAGSTVRPTGNSDGGVLAGRWIQTTITFA